MSGAGGYWLIFTLALLAALLWFIPTSWDAWSVHRDRKEKLKIYTTLAAKADTTAKQRDIAKIVGDLPIEGIHALTRGLIALLVMTGLIYILLLLFGSGVTVDSDLMKQAVTALLTTLTAVVAFYFGSRTAETRGTEGSSGTSSPASPRAGSEPDAGGPPVGEGGA